MKLYDMTESVTTETSIYIRRFIDESAAPIELEKHPQSSQTNTRSSQKLNRKTTELCHRLNKPEQGYIPRQTALTRQEQPDSTPKEQTTAMQYSRGVWNRADVVVCLVSE